jgi:hypothetical protein
MMWEDSNPLSVTKLNRARSSNFIEMERLLMLFIENNVQHHVPLSSAILQEKAISLYDELKKLCVRHQMHSVSQELRGGSRGLRGVPTFTASLCRVN